MKVNEYQHFTTDALLAIEAVFDYHDPDLVAEICDRAGLLEEYAASDGESFESILDRALEILKEDL